MSLIVDDLLVRPFVFLLDSLHTLALEEMYDIEEIQDELKENQLLYELGERDEVTYRERRRELELELEIAQDVHEQMQQKSIEVRS